MSKRSVYAFDFISSFYPDDLDPNINWMVFCADNTIIELVSGINVKDFEKKLYELDLSGRSPFINNLTIKPLTKLHYTDPDIVREVKFQHILIFAISGILVVLC